MSNSPLAMYYDDDFQEDWKIVEEIENIFEDKSKSDQPEEVE